MKKHTRLPALLAVCAISAMVLTGASPAPPDNTKNKPTQPNPKSQHGTNTYGTIDSPAFQARAEMHQVWGEHLAYVRNYIISSVADLPDAQVVATRLEQNADDIGRTLQPYYGDKSSQKLTTLMRDHVSILTELVEVASGNTAGVMGGTTGTSTTGDTAGTTGGTASSDRTTTNQSTDRNMGGTTGTPGSTGGIGYDRDIQGLNEADRERFETAQQRLETNSKSIAAFLSGSNPNWKQTDVESMMQMHVDHVVDMVSARVNGDWQADIQAFDQAIEHTFQFAGALMHGIERQFPDRFAQAKSSTQ